MEVNLQMCRHIETAESGSTLKKFFFCLIADPIEQL